MSPGDGDPVPVLYCVYSAVCSACTVLYVHCAHAVCAICAVLYVRFVQNVRNANAICTKHMGPYFVFMWDLRVFEYNLAGFKNICIPQSCI